MAFWIVNGYVDGGISVTCRRCMADQIIGQNQAEEIVRARGLHIIRCNNCESIEFLNDKKPIENYKGGISDYDTDRVKNAIELISKTWEPSFDKFTDHTNNGSTTYTRVNLLYNRNECLGALNIIKQFIEEFAPTETEEKNHE